MRGIKKIYVILPVILLTMLVFSFSVYAQDVDIYTNVPQLHTVTINVYGGGKVYMNNSEVNGSYKIKRQSSLKYCFNPCEGYKLDKVIYDSDDVTSDIKGEYFTAVPVVRDTVMNVTFVKNNDEIASKIIGIKTDNEYKHNTQFTITTGDTKDNLIYICISTISFIIIILCIIFSNKEFKV